MASIKVTKSSLVVESQGLNSRFIFILEAIVESCEVLSTEAVELSSCMVGRLVGEGLVQLENVRNVPRQYRRTNKDVSIDLPLIYKQCMK